MDSYVVGYEYINLRYGWVLSNYGTFPLGQMKNQEEIRKEAKACVEAVNKTLPRYCRIREIKFREREFEKTSSMKIRR